MHRAPRRCYKTWHCRSARDWVRPLSHSIPRRGYLCACSTLSGDANTSCLRTFDASTDLEFHALTFIEVAKTVPLDLGVVDEHISSAALLRDEAEALLSVESLHGAFRHDLLPFLSKVPSCENPIFKEHDRTRCKRLVRYAGSTELTGEGLRR